mmetsp:Transcript_651/g.1276  ORF Transcript_651/g.1276 Transcript_651/m.1276 type:complete len:155 (+) Transcript_651:136-600(+)
MTTPTKVAAARLPVWKQRWHTAWATERVVTSSAGSQASALSNARRLPKGMNTQWRMHACEKDGHDLVPSNYVLKCRCLLPQLVHANAAALSVFLWRMKLEGRCEFQAAAGREAVPAASASMLSSTPFGGSGGTGGGRRCSDRCNHENMHALDIR